MATVERIETKRLPGADVVAQSRPVCGWVDTQKAAGNSPLQWRISPGVAVENYLTRVFVAEIRVNTDSTK